MKRSISMCLLVLAFSTSAALAQKDEEKIFTGKWEVESAQRVGKPFDKPVGSVLTFTDGKVNVAKPNGDSEGDGTFKVNSKADPKEVDITPSEGPGDLVLSGIYKLEGKTLTICLNPKARPEKFETSEDNPQALMLTLKRKE